MKRPDNPRLMESLLPPEGTKVLEDLAVELISATGASRITRPGAALLRGPDGA